jgi:uncharacterized protein (DUF1697 family)
VATCVCLIRGINVGGRNTVRLQDLRDRCPFLGFTAVETDLQSGKPVLDAGRRSPSTVAATRNWKTVQAVAETAVSR